MSSVQRDDIDEAITWYEACVRGWAQEGDVEQANALIRRKQELFKAIRDVDRGRATILRLTQDPEPGVRLLAATSALWFAPDVGVTVLDALRSQPGLLGFTAQQTLSQYRAGRLDLDW